MFLSNHHELKSLEILMLADSLRQKGFAVFDNTLFLLIITELLRVTSPGQTKAPICLMSCCQFLVFLNMWYGQQRLMSKVLQEKIDLSL